MVRCEWPLHQLHGRSHLELLNLTLCIDFDHLTQVSPSDSRGDNSDRACLGSEIRGEYIDDAGEFLPRSLYVFNARLSPKFPGLVAFASADHPIHLRQPLFDT